MHFFVLVNMLLSGNVCRFSHVTAAPQLCHSAVSGSASDFAFCDCFQPTTLLLYCLASIANSSDCNALTRLHAALLHHCDVPVNQVTRLGLRDLGPGCARSLVHDNMNEQVS